MAVNDPFGNFADGDKDNNAGLAPSSTSPAAQPTGSSGGGDTSSGPSGSTGGSGHSDFVNFGDASGRVYRTGNPTEFLNYTLSDTNLELTEVIWSWKTDSETEFKELAKAAYKSAAKDLPQPLTQFNPDGIEFNMTWFVENATGSSGLGWDMQLAIGWKKDNVFGSTTSGLFTIIDKTANGAYYVEKSTHLTDEMASTTELAGVEKATATSSGSSATGDNSDTGGAEAGSPSATQSASAGASKSKSGGGGLSTGAKAGIGVGAALGALLLIGVLLWFLFRRRRQSKDKTGYKGQQSSNTYMVDKETTGRVTESPTSPYSDDNQGQHVPLTDIETARDAPTTHAPYEDAPPRSSLGSHGDRGTGTHTPQGVSTNVAHLVEEGMTADEIRRLEEEERQLDDEIERAAERGARR